MLKARIFRIKITYCVSLNSVEILHKFVNFVFHQVVENIDVYHENVIFGTISRHCNVVRKQLHSYKYSNSVCRPFREVTYRVNNLDIVYPGVLTLLRMESLSSNTIGV